MVVEQMKVQCEMCQGRQACDFSQESQKNILRTWFSVVRKKTLSCFSDISKNPRVSL